MLQIFAAFFLGGAGGDPEPVATEAVAHVQSVAGSATATTSDTIVIPTVETNDLLLFFATNKGANAAPTVVDDDTGGNTWTRADATNSGGSLWYKRATLNTSGKTITASGFTTGCAVGLSVYRNVDLDENLWLDSLIEAVQGSGVETLAGHTPNPARNNTMICISIHNKSINTVIQPISCTDPGLLQDRFERNNTAQACSTVHASELQENINATGDFNWAQTNAAHTTFQFDLFSEITPGGVGDGGISLWRRRRRGRH